MGDYCKLTLPKSGGLTQMKKKTKFDDITENTQGLINKSLLLDWEDIFGDSSFRSQNGGDTNEIK